MEINNTVGINPARKNKTPYLVIIDTTKKYTKGMRHKETSKKGMTEGF